MKSISEIQDAVNRLSIYVKKQLSEISADLDTLKATRQATPPDVLERIEKQAQSNPICNYGLKTTSDKTRQIYMRLLSALAIGNEDKLLFVRRIGVGSGCKWDANRLVDEGMYLDEQFMDILGEQLKDLCYPLLLDCLVTANLSGEAKKKDLELIAGVAGLLKCEDNSVAILAQLAAAVIQKDKKLFDSIVCEEQMPGLSHLIPPEWLNSVKVGRFSKDEHIMCVKSGYVKKKQKLFSEKNRYSTKYISASVNGIIAYVPKDLSAANPRVFNVYINSPFCDDNFD